MGSAGRRVTRSTALAAAFALGTLIEDLVRPTVTVNGRHYDRAPRSPSCSSLTVAVALLALRGRLGVLSPLGALVASARRDLPAPAFALNTTFVFLFVMLVCGIAGYLAADRRGLAGLVVVLATAALAEARNPHHTLGNGALVAAFMAIAWGVGLLARRPVPRPSRPRRAARRFEQEQEEAARRAVAEERQRIARELHDIIAHSVSVMTMQTGAFAGSCCPSSNANGGRSFGRADRPRRDVGDAPAGGPAQGGGGRAPPTRRIPGMGRWTRSSPRCAKPGCRSRWVRG